MGKGTKGQVQMNEEKILTPLKAIRQKCLDCMCGNSNEVKLCTMENKCPLYPYRTGHNPYRKGREYTEEERAEVAKRLQKARCKN